MTNHGSGHPWHFRDPWTLTYPDQPLVDEESATVLQDAIEELTLLRSPMALGDCLAELHASLSLLAQLRVCISRSVASARDQDYTWAEIAAQLEVTPAAAQRRYRTSLRESDGRR
jgi:hypothetical protein